MFVSMANFIQQQGFQPNQMQALMQMTRPNYQLNPQLAIAADQNLPGRNPDQNLPEQRLDSEAQVVDGQDQGSQNSINPQ